MLNPKSQILNPKQIQNSNYPVFSFLVLFVIWCLGFGIFTNVYALSLEKIKVYFLEGNYKSAISEGERIMAGATTRTHNLDELYYILGLSYLKDDNLLRASDIFEIILKEFKKSKFREEATLSLGDVYYLRADLYNAERYYRELITNFPGSKFMAQIYYRLSKIAFKKGNTQQGRAYLAKLKKEFPSSPELKVNRDLYALSDTSNIYYTVQVGSFSKVSNARNLRDELIKKGYDAYIEEFELRNRKTYRVRVGKSRMLSQASRLEKKLSQAGYPTKIYP